MLPALMGQLVELEVAQSRVAHMHLCSHQHCMLPVEVRQLEVLERRGLERQQQGKVRRKEQHLAARTRQEQAAAEAACHPRSVPASCHLGSSCRVPPQHQPQGSQAAVHYSPPAGHVASCVELNSRRRLYAEQCSAGMQAVHASNAPLQYMSDSGLATAPRVSPIAAIAGLQAAHHFTSTLSALLAGCLQLRHGSSLKWHNCPEVPAA